MNCNTNIKYDILILNPLCRWIIYGVIQIKRNVMVFEIMALFVCILYGIDIID